MWISWSKKEREAMRQLAKVQDVSEKAVIRQALRLYQLDILRHAQGYRRSYRNDAGEVHPMEKHGGCMGDD